MKSAASLDVDALLQLKKALNSIVQARADKLERDLLLARHQSRLSLYRPSPVPQTLLALAERSFNDLVRFR